MSARMLRLPVAISFLSLSIVSCARQAPAPAQAAKPAQQSESPAQPVPPPTVQREVQEATASQETGEGATQERSDATLERLAAMPADQQLPGGKWKPGANYSPLVPAQPTNAPPGKVEVVEVFWYGCPHCYALEPFMASWLKNKPDYIQFVRVPVMWGPAQRAHAHLFYTLEALGRPDLHQKVFDAIHQHGKLLVTNDEQATRKLQLDFARENGISEADFTKAYDSFTVNSNLQRAEQLTARYQVQGVPLVIVNGKYTTDVTQAGSPGNLLQLINDLAASEKRH